MSRSHTPLKLVVWIVALMLVAATLPLGGTTTAAATATRTVLIYPSQDLPLSFVVERLKLDVMEQYDAFDLVNATDTQIGALRNIGLQVQVLNDANKVYVGSYTIDTDQGEPGLPGEWRTNVEPGQPGYFIVQFVGPVKDLWLDQAQEQGLTIAGYLPQFAAVVKGTPEAVDAFSSASFVRWTGTYQPGYRVPQLNSLDPTAFVKPAGQGEKSAYYVEFFAGEKAEALLALAKQLGLDVDSVTTLEGSNGRIRVELQASPLVLSALARTSGVAYIQPAVDLQVLNEKSRAVTETGTAYDHGLTGEGQLVAITDTGLDYQHEMFAGTGSPGPSHRKVAAFIDLSGLSLSRDAVGHGTHVAGTILGDAPPYGVANNHDGHAIGAKAIVVKVFNELGLFGAGNDLYQIFLEAQNAGARINSNSWGGATNGDYDQLTADTDRFAHDYPQHLLVFANGNFGTDGNGSVGTPGGAKNVISVGAIQTDTPNNVPDWSSRGPTADGRMKPDVVAPGEYVTSAKAGTTDQYVEEHGTSMATPQVSGLAALVRDYFMEGYYPSGQANASDAIEPSSALLKAVLINGAVEVNGDLSDAANSGHYPNNSQGWGRVNLENSLYFSGDSRGMTVWDSPTELQTGSKWTGQFVVPEGNSEVKVHLVWTDAPGEPSAQKALVNDLNLRVTAPDGTTFVGNSLKSIDPGYSVAGGSFDTVNNVEGVRLIANLSEQGTLPTGTYTVEVTGANVPSGPQSFAVVASYGLGSGNVPEPPEEPEPPVEPEPPQPPTPGQKSIALVGDYQGQLERALTSQGFAVTAYDRGHVDELINNMASVDGLVVARLDRPVDVARLSEAANANGVGQVYLGDYPLPMSGLGALSDQLGDPMQAQASWQNGPVIVTVDAEHPVFDGFTVGDSIVLVDGMENDYQTFDGYTGSVIGTSAMSNGLRGMIGVRENAAGTREVVVGGLGPNEFTDTTAWTDAGRTVFANAVTWVAGE